MDFFWYGSPDTSFLILTSVQYSMIVYAFPLGGGGGGGLGKCADANSPSDRDFLINEAAYPILPIIGRGGEHPSKRGIDTGRGER